MEGPLAVVANVSTTGPSSLRSITSVGRTRRHRDPAVVDDRPPS
jgi:hypothetical protein